MQVIPANTFVLEGAPEGGGHRLGEWEKINTIAAYE